MKKILSILSATGLCLAAIYPINAAEITTTGGTGDTTITAYKEPSYSIVIPETAEIDFNEEVNSIGSIEYKEGNLEPDAMVTVTLTNQSDLVNVNNKDCKIPYLVKSQESEFLSVDYPENTKENTITPLTVNITKDDWEKAKAGKYEATLTFTFEYYNPHV